MLKLKCLISFAYRLPCYIQLLNLVLTSSRVLVSSFSSSRRRESTKILNTNLRGVFAASRLRPRFLLRLSFVFFRAAPSRK
jgi:hypothetical protein